MLSVRLRALFVGGARSFRGRRGGLGVGRVGSEKVAPECDGFVALLVHGELEAVLVLATVKEQMGSGVFCVSTRENRDERMGRTAMTTLNVMIPNQRLKTIERQSVGGMCLAAIVIMPRHTLTSSMTA